MHGLTEQRSSRPVRWKAPHVGLWPKTGGWGRCLRTGPVPKRKHDPSDVSYIHFGLDELTVHTAANRLWSNMCFMPQWDQDFDGLGDTCDMCPFAFDPTNAPIVDADGRLWPKAGQYCNGEYELENICPQ